MMYRITAGFSLCLHLVEVACQLWAAVEYYHAKQLTTWFAVISTTILLPLFLTNLVSLCLVFKNMDFEEKYCGRFVCFGFHVVQFGQLWRYFKLLLAFDVVDINEFSILRLGNYMTGSVLYIILQCYLMIVLKHWSIVAICSVIASLISGACTLTLYNTPQKVFPTTSYQNVRGLVHFLWRFFMLLSRFVALSMFAVALQLWVFLVIGGHWAVLFLWSQSQEIFTSKVKTKTCLHRVYDAARCYVQCFDLLTVASNKKWRIVIIYYVIILAENSLMIIIWFTGSTDHLGNWYTIPAIITTFLSYVCGFIFMVINFKCFTVRQQPLTEESSTNDADLKDILSNLDFIQEELIWDTFGCGDISKEGSKHSVIPTFHDVPTVRVNTVHEVVHYDNSEMAPVTNGNVQKHSHSKGGQQRQRRRLPEIPSQNARRSIESRINHVVGSNENTDIGSHASTNNSGKYQKLSNTIEQSSSTSRNTHTMDTSLNSSYSGYPEEKNKGERTTRTGRKLPMVPCSNNVKVTEWFADAQRYDLESCLTIDSNKSVLHRAPSCDSHYQTCESSSSGTPDDFTMTRSHGFDYQANYWETLSDTGSNGSDSDLAMTWPPSNPKFTIENLTNIPDMTSDPFESVSSWLERINRPYVTENVDYVPCTQSKTKGEIITPKENVGACQHEHVVENGFGNENNSQIENQTALPTEKKRLSFRLRNPILRICSLHSDLGGIRKKVKKKKKKKMQQMEERMAQRQRPRRVVSIESMV